MPPTPDSVQPPDERAPHDIHLRWAQRADIPAIARILTTNLQTFEFFDHFAARRHSQREEFHAFVLHRVRMFFVRSACRFMVAEKLELGMCERGAHGVVVGFSTWEARGGDDADGLAEAWRRQDGGWVSAVERRLVEVEGWYHRWVRNTVVDYAAFARAWRALHEGQADRGRRLRLRSNLHLQYLMVDPAWQRGHGVGRRLIQWGLDVADQLGLPVLLESSLAGYPFYLQRGFRLLTMVRIDNDPEKAYDMPVLVYEPRRREGHFVPALQDATERAS